MDPLPTQSTSRWAHHKVPNLPQSLEDLHILAWGSCLLLRTRLVSRYADCLAWLERIEGDKTETIFYSPT